MKKFPTTFAAILLAALMPGPAWAAQDNINQLKVKAAFEDVKLDVTDAIINRGYKIDHTSYIGKMLSRTGSDVGSTKPVYKDAELVQFCSAVLSRNIMEADPANIAFCPYVVFYYERADEPGTVYIGFRKMGEQGTDASKKALKAINDLLQEIVEEAAGQ